MYDMKITEAKMFETVQDHSMMPGGEGAVPRISEMGDLSTQTIDVNSLFDPELYETRSFDLRSIESTSFGKILDSLPLPALVLDQLHYIVFANQSCARMAPRSDHLQGRAFTDLVASPRNADRARALIDKTESVLQRAFEKRKPLVAEAILEFEDQRIWSRLYLRTVRIGSSRYVLVMIEDVTSEKTREKMVEREHSRTLEQNRELDAQVRGLTEELGQTKERLRDTTRKLQQLQEKLQLEQHKIETV
jgi:two-component system, cell cycle sensor histidine kinase and response regulator CckA